MAQRKVNFIEESFYHLYNRGNSKQIIFHDKEDYTHFIMLLYISNSDKRFVTDRVSNDIYMYERGDPIVAIGAYCLMPNHFHILLTQLKENGVSSFMKKISTAYVMYYNKKYKRTGSLFEGRFKALYATDDRYLKYLYSYIHLNPVKLINPMWKENNIKDIQKTISFLQAYQYSSFLDYFDKNHVRKEKHILDIDKFPKYFTLQGSFQKEVFSWLKLKP